MLTVEAPSSIYQRFATYYLNRLSALAAKLDASFEEAMTLFDEDLGQIRQTIHSLNTWAAQDAGLARIALNFAKVDSRLLTLRLTGDERIAYIKTALEAARQIQDEGAVRECLLELGVVYSDIDRYEESQRCLQELLVSSQKDGDIRNEARAWHHLGAIDNYQSRPVEARQKLENGIALLKKIGDKSEIYAALLANLANTYSAERKHEMAIHVLQEALVLLKEQRDLFRLVTALNNLGDDYVGLGRYSEALVAYEEGIQIARSIGYELKLGILLGNMGYLHLRLGNPGTAQTYLEESVMVSKTTGKLFAQLLFSAILFHLALTAEKLGESYSQICGLITLAFERKMIGIVLLLFTAIAKWYFLAGDPVRSLQLLDFVSTRPELEHEGHYLVERVRHEVADSFPALPPATPLDQPLDDVVAAILSEHP